MIMFLFWYLVLDWVIRYLDILVLNWVIRNIKSENMTKAVTNK
jgi:hypothetical protein